MYFCYILYSPKLNKFYVGETLDLERRIYLHNSGSIEGAYTSQANDWHLYFKIECESRLMARKIEAHLKRMKSRKYLENLKRYPEMVEKLREKYAFSGSSRQLSGPGGTTSLPKPGRLFFTTTLILITIKGLSYSVLETCYV